MDVTVSDVMQLEIMAGARLLAGKRGLSRKVEFIDILESPGGIPMLKRNDVLVTTIYPVLNDETSQRTMMHSLHELGVSMLCIKVHRYIEVVPSFMVELAEILDLPLVEIPPTLDFGDIIHDVTALIIGNQAATLQESLDINKMFTNILKDGGTLDDLTRALSSTICCPVIVESTNKTILSYAFFSLENLPNEEDWLAAYRSLRSRNTIINDDNITLLTSKTEPPCQFALAKAAYRGETEGSILISYQGKFTELRRVALENAASFISLALATEKSQRDKEETVKHSILNDLLHSNTPVWDNYPFWFKRLGIDDSLPYLVFLIQTTSGQTTDSSLFSYLLQQRLSSAIVHMEGTIAVVVLPLSQQLSFLGNPDEKAENFFSDLLTFFQNKMPSIMISIAVGNVVESIYHISRSYNQACTSHKIGKILRSGNLFFFSSMQLYNILINHPQDDLKEFCLSVLEPIMSNSRLRFDAISTLETYINMDTSLERTATAMFLHLSTVKYRINRIREALGVERWSMEYMFKLQFALMVYKIYFSPEADLSDHIKNC